MIKNRLKLKEISYFCFLSIFLFLFNVFLNKTSINAASAAVPSISVVETSELMSDIVNMMTQFVIVGGAFWTVWGVVVLAGGLKDKNGPALQSGIWQIVGGALIIVAAALFKILVKF
jgi:hypothetical protein